MNKRGCMRILAWLCLGLLAIALMLMLFALALGFGAIKSSGLLG